MDIGQILERAARENASDVILTTGVPPVLYVGSKLLRYGNDLLTAQQTQEMVYSLLEQEQIARFEKDRELDFSFQFDQTHRFRGNAFWQRGCVGGALRLIRNDIPSLEDLHLPPVLRKLTELPQGLVLVTGPTGHGKSTTIASMIDCINRKRSCHIVTIEDPIEFMHVNRCAVVEQREVGTDTRSFASAVRHVLRQAPHVIVVGEMRDLETIQAVLTAAETGHLVFATLHTNDATQTIDRIVDVFPPHQQTQTRVQLSMSLSAVVSQRLLAHSDGKSRIVAAEVLRNIHSIAHLIREGKTPQIPGIVETNNKLGMQSMDMAVKEIFLQGEITEATARKAMK
jgi:twitching motility protein PilT